MRRASSTLYFLFAGRANPTTRLERAGRCADSLRDFIGEKLDFYATRVVPADGDVEENHRVPAWRNTRACQDVSCRIAWTATTDLQGPSLDHHLQLDRSCESIVRQNAR